MLFRIGDIIKYLGFSKSGLSLYEKYGIMKSKREENGYRYFSRIDFIALFETKGLRSLGFSMKDIASLYEASSLQEGQNACRKRVAELRRELELTKRKADNLEQRCIDADQASQEVMKWTMRNRPGLYRVEYMNKDGLVQSGSLCTRKLMELTPMSFLCMRLTKDEFDANEPGLHGGVALWEKDIDLLTAQTLKTMVHYPERKCLSTVMYAEGIAKPEVIFDQLRLYLEEHDLCLCGDILFEVIFDYGQKNQNSRYRRVWIPVESI